MMNIFFFYKHFFIKKSVQIKGTKIRTNSHDDHQAILKYFHMSNFWEIFSMSYHF